MNNEKGNRVILYNPFGDKKISDVVFMLNYMLVDSHVPSTDTKKIELYLTYIIMFMNSTGIQLTLKNITATANYHNLKNLVSELKKELAFINENTKGGDTLKILIDDFATLDQKIGEYIFTNLNYIG
jgi:hypothetical protein